MFDQEKLDILIEADYVYSSDIVLKVLFGELKEKQSCLDDWLRLLDNNTINCFMDYCEECLKYLGTMVDSSNEEKNDILADLIYIIYVIIEMETGEELENIEVEDLVEKIEIISIVTSLEILRRSKQVKSLKKCRLSDKDSGLYIKND